MPPSREPTRPDPQGAGDPGARWLEVHAKPGARVEGMRVREDGVVEVRVRARAVEGAANDAIVALLARALGLPRSRVHLVHGARARSKRIAVDGMDAASARARIATAGGPHRRDDRGRDQTGP